MVIGDPEHACRDNSNGRFVWYAIRADDAAAGPPHLPGNPPTKGIVR
jgi:hypothetical protein